VAEADPIVREIYIDAPPEGVFPYLVNGDRYSLWMGLVAELDPRPGGIYRVQPNSSDVLRGEFLVVEPPRRVVFSWGFEGAGHAVPAGSTTVEIELVPQGAGTLLRLTHRGGPPERRERHARGWSHYLARLESIATGRDPGPDPFARPEVRHG
jgi:uncharacterized protein YndB with AHSA1/START domain